MKRRSSKGNTLALALAACFVLLMLGFFFYKVIMATGGKRQVKDALNYGALNLAKAVTNQIGIPLQPSNSSTPSPAIINFGAFQNNGVMDLANYNRAVGQAVLVAVNASDENTKNAYSNAQALVNLLQGDQNSLGAQLTALYSSPANPDANGNSIQAAFMNAATSNPVVMDGQNVQLQLDFGTGMYKVGFILGADMNFSANPTLFLELATLNLVGCTNPDPVNNGSSLLKGYTPLKIPVGSQGTISVMGVSLNPRQAPFLTSVTNFNANVTSPLQSTSSNSASASGANSPIPPNAFLSSVTATKDNESSSGNDSSQVAAVAAAMNADNSNVHQMSIPYGYIVVSNPSGLPQGNSTIADTNNVLNNELMEGVYTSNNNVFSTDPSKISAWVTYNTGKTSALPARVNVCTAKVGRPAPGNNPLIRAWNWLTGAVYAQSSTSGSTSTTSSSTSTSTSTSSSTSTQQQQPSLDGLYNPDGSPLTLDQAKKITSLNANPCTWMSVGPQGDPNCQSMLKPFTTAYGSGGTQTVYTNGLTSVNGMKAQVMSDYAQDATKAADGTPLTPYTLTPSAPTGMQHFDTNAVYVTDPNPNDTWSRSNTAGTYDALNQSGDLSFTRASHVGAYLNMIANNVPEGTNFPNVSYNRVEKSPIMICWKDWPQPFRFFGQILENVVTAIIPSAGAQPAATLANPVEQRLYQRMTEIYPNLTQSQFDSFLTNVLYSDSNKVGLGQTWYVYQQNKNAQNPPDKDPNANFVMSQTPPPALNPLNASKPISPPLPDGPPPPNITGTSGGYQLSSGSDPNAPGTSFVYQSSYNIMGLSVNPPHELGIHDQLFTQWSGGFNGHDAVTWQPSSGFNNLLGVLNFQNSTTVGCEGSNCSPCGGAAGSICASN